MSHLIFSDNKYVFWRIACDVLSSKTKLINDMEIKYKRNQIKVPIYVPELLFIDFNTKKKALEYCKKLIEQGFLKKKIPFAHRRLIKNKNLRIEKWIRYKFNPMEDVLPSKKQEKIDEFKVAQ